MAISKFMGAFEDAIEDAADAIRPDAGYELSEIEVKEVSFVDHAANRKKFLVVKNVGATNMGKKSTEKNDALVLSPKLKEDAAASLLGSLGQLVKVSNILKEATTDDKEGVDKLPADIIDGLRVVAKGLTSMLLEHSVAKGAGQLAEALVAISEGSIALAEEIAVTGDEVEPEALEKMEKLASLFASAVKTAKGDASDTAEKNDGDKPAADTADTADKPAADTADKPAADTAEKNEDPLLTALVAGQTVMQEAIAGLAISIAAQNKPAEPTANEELSKRLNAVKTDLAKRNEALDDVTARLKLATEEAPLRSSSSDNGSSGSGSGDRSNVAKNGDGRNIFPAVYGNETYDPTPQA